MTADDVRALVAEVLDGGDVEVVHPPARDVRRLGIALEPDADLDAWCEALELDAVLLHRPWGAAVQDGVGLLGAHEALDAMIVPWLADVARMATSRWLGPQLLVGLCEPGARERIAEALGGEEGFHAGALAEEVVAIASAMTDELVRAAAAAGAGLYVTGTWRVPGADAVTETAIDVQVTGHERTERWALRELAGRLEAGELLVFVDER